MRVAFRMNWGRWMLWHPIQAMRDLWGEARGFFQRGWRGYSDYDMWNVHSHTCDVYRSMLREWAGRTCSYPYGLTPEGWERRLRVMADGFDAGKRIIEWDYKDKAEHDKLYRQWKRGWLLMGNWFFTMWD